MWEKPNEYKKPSRIDFIEQVVYELINGREGYYWGKVISWFAKYEPEDDGVRFIWDSIFTDRYIQSIYMYKGMLKFVLYLYKWKHEPNFKYEYNPDRINFISNFWVNNFILSEGAFQKKFKMEANQIYKICRLYGFSMKENKKANIWKDKGIKFMVNKFYDVETRKNGKSEFFAALGVFVQLNPFGNDARPQIYISGPVKDQSAILWNKAKNFVKVNPVLSNIYEANNTRRLITYAGGNFTALAFTTEGSDGFNPSLTVNTEYHQVPNDLMVNSQESAQNASRPNALIIYDTTKGLGINGVAYNREYRYKDNVDAQLENPKETKFENIATFMAELDPPDEYSDFDSPWETNIFRKSTPMVGVIIALEAIQKEWNEAKNEPSARREFLIKKGGRWIGAKSSMFEHHDLIESNNKWKDTWSPDDLKNQECFISIDLANTTDTNAITTVFKGVTNNGQDIFLSKSHIFVPRDTLEMRKDKERKPYDAWIEQGHVSLAGDRSIDYSKIADYINNLMGMYKVKKILYDKAFFHHVKTYLVDKHKVSESMFEDVPQNAVNLSAPMEDLIKKIVDHQFYFFENPVTIDHFINMSPSHTSAGLLYFQKTKQEQRIDIFATNVIAMKRYNELSPIGKAREVDIETWTID